MSTRIVREGAPPVLDGVAALLPSSLAAANVFTEAATVGVRSEERRVGKECPV